MIFGDDFPETSPPVVNGRLKNEGISMSSLEIVITKKGFDIRDREQSRPLVSGIQRMDEALSVFQKLSYPSDHLVTTADPLPTDWPVVPGSLVAN